MEVALSQLAWLAYGFLLGAIVALGVAFQRGWFHRRTELNVDWASIEGGMRERLDIRIPPTNVVVDWGLIHSVVQGEGYMLVAKPREALLPPAAKH